MDKIFLDKLNDYCKMGLIKENFCNILKEFYFSYKTAIKNRSHKNDSLKNFTTFLDIVKEQTKNPHKFSHYHKKIRKPFDYYLFGIQFLKPLIDIKNSHLLGIENLKKIKSQLETRENVILLANHQIESDPQAISILLEKDFEELASKIIYVAGERVIKDPLAIPFSMGCDLLCIYSKKYINNPPNLKREKQLHNKKTMQLMSTLLKEGRKIIYVAPSGGRDRPDDSGTIQIAPFDPQSLEMFYLMAQKAETKTHFYPLSLHTYNILPPPDKTQIEMGEKRITKSGKIDAFFGKEIDMEMFNNLDKILKRKKRAEYIYNLVKTGYETLKDLK
jgi:glycerol-3-phosphate O-acyltransferase